MCVCLCLCICVLALLCMYLSGSQKKIYFKISSSSQAVYHQHFPGSLKTFHWPLYMLFYFGYFSVYYILPFNFSLKDKTLMAFKKIFEVKIIHNPIILAYLLSSSFLIKQELFYFLVHNHYLSSWPRNSSFREE